jgi:hypothetical protein
MRFKKIKLLHLSLLLLTSTVHAVILYSGDNSANQAAPVSGAPFESVARVCNNGGGGTSGSAVHIRGKYMLTANHVQLRSHVTFDGVTYWARDSAFTPIQIGPTDMKLIKLVNSPGLPSTELFSDNVGDTSVAATLIGWGVGRDTGVNDLAAGSTNIWQWGNTGTLEKRWGTNTISASASGEVTDGYSYSHLLTYIDRNAGINEAAATLYDSGSGLYLEQNGTWKLAGLTTAITSINGPTEQEPANPYNSTFGISNSRDRNFFVRISSYASAIEVAIPDTDTYAGWKTDHSLYGADADNTADTDDDGISQLHEFAFGGDPNVNDISILPTHSLVEDGVSSYLELNVTRPIGLQGISYTPRTTTDLTNWPVGSIDIVNPNPTPVNNLDGTETLTYRRTQAVAAADKAFLQVEISETP